MTTTTITIEIEFVTFSEVEDRLICFLPNEKIMEEEGLIYTLRKIQFTYEKKQWIQMPGDEIVTGIMEKTNNTLLNYMNSFLKESTKPALEIISNEGNNFYTNTDYVYVNKPEYKLVHYACASNDGEEIEDYYHL